MTLDKLVFDVREALKEYSDDSEFSNRYIEYLISVKRAKYLKQELDRFGRKFNNSVLQTFCSPVEVVSSDECGLDVSCNDIARTKISIPTTLQLTTRDSISRVAPSNKMAKPFTFLDRNMAVMSQHSIFQKNIKAFLHDDGYLYFIAPDGIYHFDCVSITGIFEDPTELGKLSKCCDCDDSEEVDNSCYDPYGDDYPVPAHMIDLIRLDIIQELTRTESLPQDTENDTQDER